MKPRVNVLLRSEQTNGVLAVMDNGMSAGAQGPPLHLHDFDETFNVLDGELTFQLGDELHTKRAGELAFAAGGVAHTFANLSDADARVLLVCTPGGFERHFDRVAAREDGVEPPPEAAGPIPEVTRVGPRIGEAGLLPAPPAPPTPERPARPAAPFHRPAARLRQRRAAQRHRGRGQRGVRRATAAPP